jgi:hypothetical protein
LLFKCFLIVEVEPIMLSRIFRRSLAPTGRRFIHSPHQSNSNRYIWTHLLAGVAGGLSVVGAGNNKLLDTCTVNWLIHTQATPIIISLG